MRRPQIWIAPVVAWVLCGAASAGTSARYRMLSSVARTPPPVTECRITIGPAETTTDGTQGQWWSIRFQKQDEDFQIWCLSEQIPMRTALPARSPGRLWRYIYREGNRRVLEYRRESTGEDLLPGFDWQDNFLPHPKRATVRSSGWAVSGRCMGHVIGLLETHESAEWDLPSPQEITVLLLDDELLVATCLSKRDINHGMKPEGDYTYRRWDEADVQAVIGAGFNMMIVHSPELEDWVWQQPVFQVGAPDPYPQMFFRSTYLGSHFFIDEPAHHVATREQRRFFADIPRYDLMYDLLTSFTEVALQAQSSHIMRAGAACLMGKAVPDVNWGTLQVRNELLPAWETYCPAAFCEMDAGARAVIIEGRFQRPAFNAQVAEFLGEDVNVNVEEMLGWHVAFLRGAARTFRGEWGMSIYGQADPEIAKVAVVNAYKAGARYIWFWTNDHDHHVPFERQLELARLVSAAKRNDRQPRNLAELRAAATAAVVLPEGYIFTMGGPLLGNYSLSTTSRDAATAPRRVVQQTIVRAGLELMRNGVTFDYVNQCAQLDSLGYHRLLHVQPDGTVREAQKVSSP
ncbi:MAG: hypothetical protein AMXMBFR13_29150 [Phycisphaerae bacterium]